MGHRNRDYPELPPMPRDWQWDDGGRRGRYWDDRWYRGGQDGWPDAPREWIPGGWFPEMPMPEPLPRPRIPGTPGTPEMPEMPGMPGMPGMPEMPEMPWMPGMPGMPEMPQMPGMPGMPERELPPDLEERIVSAIADERMAAEFYRRLAEMAPTEEFRRRIAHIREDELDHLRNFTNLYRTLYNRRPPRRDEPVPEFRTFEQGIREAFRREQMAQAEYRDLHLATMNMMVRHVTFDALIDELQHADSFLYILIRMATDRD